MMKSIKHYKNNQLFRDFLFKKRIKNVMNHPKMDKILLNLTNKEILTNSTKLFILLMLLKLISGQKPKITKAKKSIAQFKLRKGKAIGCKITLRKEMMYFFLDKIIYSILPQIIEVKTTTIKSNFNSLNIGIEDLSIFSELESQYEFLKNTQGFNITFVLKNNKLKTNSDYFFSGIKIPIQKEL
jgi:large subunit ribosomal protein L5